MTDYEAQKIKLEEDKLNLEERKLAHEKERGKWTTVQVLGSLFAVLATVFAASLTVLAGIWSAEKQAKAQLQVELAKAIMSATTITETLYKADIVQDQCSAENVKIIGAKNHPTSNRSDAWGLAEQKQLFRAMEASDMKPRQIQDLWIENVANNPKDDNWAARERI